MSFLFKEDECPNRDHPFPEKCKLCGHKSGKEE